MPAELLEVSIPIISNSQCQDVYGSSTITSNMLCAGTDAGGIDACQVCLCDSKKPWYIAGNQISNLYIIS